MFVEFWNETTNQYYYLCGTNEAKVVLGFSPDVKDKLLALDPKDTVTEFKDMVKPLIEKLMKGNPGKWSIWVFSYNEAKPTVSLTRPPEQITYIAQWKVGDRAYINGVLQPLCLVTI